jgi:preprotein translocase SecF subunit
MDARGIDFKGGTAISFRLEKETAIDQVREKVRGVRNESGHPKYEDAEVQIMAAVGEALSEVASIRKTASKFFQVRTSHQNVDEIRIDLLDALKGELNPEIFMPVDLVKNPPQPSRIFDRTINGAFAVFVKGKDKPVDPAAFAKELETHALPFVDKNADGAAYLMVRPAENFGDWSRFHVYVAGASANDAKAQIERIEDKVKNTAMAGYIFPTSPFISYDKIGPAAAAELRNSTIWALIISWVLMIIYIWVRFFSVKFGAAAVIALVHDSVISVGAVLVMYLIIPKGLGLSFELSLSTVAAVLTIIGFSINDTIVIFDRIRENLNLMKRASFSEIINASVNQMLGRTLITSVTAWISALCLYVATMTSSSGMSGLAFPLLIGFIAGVYSTVYICGPILVWWYRGERPILEKS